MNIADTARNTKVQVILDGVDISDEISRYFLSLTYTDSEEDESDDLQIKLLDRDGLWLESWLEEAVQAAAAAKLSISAVIQPVNWANNTPLPTGSFELENVEYSFPPAEITLSATALPFSSSVRQTRKSKVWENYNLQGIAEEIAGNGGLSCFFEAAANPYYERKEQEKTSDISFLSGLCHDAGISLKVTDGKLVLFDQTIYESKEPVLTIYRAAGAKNGEARTGGGAYISGTLSSGSADTQYASCRVSYDDPATGTRISGTAYATEDDTDSGQCLEVYAKVASEGEAKALAEKRLRLYNKLNRQISLTLTGQTALVAGATVRLSGWGAWSGLYFIRQAVHSVDSSGYVTKIDLRRCLSGY